MSDEAKPPKDDAAAAPKRPRKPAANKPAVKKPTVKKAGQKKAAAGPQATTPPDTVAGATDEAATQVVAADAAEAQTQVVAAAAADPETQILPVDGAETETQAVAPDAATTQPIPEPPTQVMAAAGTSPLPAAGSAPPAPPFGPVPRSVEKSGDGDRNVTVWLVLALAAVAVVAVVLVWAFALRDTGEQFVGNWAPVDGGGGGLVVSLADGDFTVAMYDEDLELLGSYPASRDGDVLTYRFTDIQSGRGQMKATLTYDEDRDVLALRLAGADSQGAAAEYVRVDALEAAAPPTPSPTITPTASPTASPTGSPSPSPSPSETDTAVLDQRVVEGVSAINQGIISWAAANGNVFPAAAEVSADGGVGQYVSSWPANPYTGQPMASGSQPGDYTYEQLNGGQSYKITGYLSSGTFFVP